MESSAIVLLEPGGWTTPCGRVRFPVKGTEFSTVNHSEKKFIWSKIPSLSEALSDASKEDSWTDRLPRGGDSWSRSRGGVGEELEARQMAKWISNPRMSWVSAVIRKTRPLPRLLGAQGSKSACLQPEHGAVCTTKALSKPRPRLKSGCEQGHQRPSPELNGHQILQREDTDRSPCCSLGSPISEDTDCSPCCSLGSPISGHDAVTKGSILF